MKRLQQDLHAPRVVLAVQLGKAIFFVTATTPEQLDRLQYKLYGLLG